MYHENYVSKNDEMSKMMYFNDLFNLAIILYRLFKYVLNDAFKRSLYRMEKCSR